MKGIGPAGLGSMLFSLAVCALLSKKKHRSSASSALAQERKRRKRENIERMKNVIARFEGYTAEVLPFSVIGQKEVAACRKLNPGNKVEIRLADGEIKVYAGGEYIGWLYPNSDSRLLQLLEEGVRFSAFLGGRDPDYLWNLEVDFCSLIIFYKLPGVPPTKVNLE
ncbi:MAG: hypothetical protein K2K93_05905 [Muribaculaceae bacterium]|nr:hypothetical protein [Muribaculaceae bacterium]